MKLTYRPEIDGLRAIAILAVILYHASPYGYIKGGFLGVDVFFVISGYLIGRIIISEIEETKGFSYYNFYAKRARRILPALLLVMALTAPAAWLFLLPYQLVEYSKSVISSIFSVSNIYFEITQQEYGATNSALVPFLHTWSLSVEEQFYIIFPIISALIYRKSKNPITWYVIILILSLAMAQYAVYHNKSFGFYMLPTRAWELLIGTCLAVSSLRVGVSKSKTVTKYGPAIGLLLIFIAFFTFDKNTPHPSIFTLIPTTGVALIIYYASDKSLVIRALSSKPAVFVGLISYSLYLFHYPILAFSRVTNFTNGSIGKKTILFCALILASTLSYKFIERPARSKSYKNTIILTTVITISALIVIFNTAIIMHNGFSERLPPILRNSIEDKPLWELLADKNGKCWGRSNTSSIPCVLNEHGKKTAFLLGDSHMHILAASGLAEKLIDLDYKIVYYPGVFLLPNTHRLITENNQIDPINNSEYYKKILINIKSTKEPLVVIFGRTPLYLSGKYVSDGESGFNNMNWGAKLINDSTNTIISSFRETWLDIINSNNSQLAIVYPYPEPGVNVPVEFASKLPALKSNLTNTLDNELLMSMNFDEYTKRSKQSFELYNSVSHKNVLRIYPHEILCQATSNKCYLNDEEHLFYIDSDHPSKYIGEKIGDQLIQLLNRPEFYDQN